MRIYREKISLGFRGKLNSQIYYISQQHMMNGFILLPSEQINREPSSQMNQNAGSWKSYQVTC